MSQEITRPALRYLGGKFLLAPWIIAHFPPHRIYVEPFGGAASVLLRKPRSYAEVYNDLDGEVVNLFRVLRDREQGAELVRLCRLTPFARSEFEAAYQETAHPVERARRMLVRAYMGHGSTASRIDRTTGLRFDSSRGMTRVAVEWATFPDALVAIIERLQGVTIENRPAADLMAERDEADVLFYVDPPYVHATRSQKRTRGALSHGYRCELSDEDHARLVQQLLGLRGMVVLSGYAHALYDPLEQAGWRRLERAALADGARERTEILWTNPAATAALGDLFLGAA